MQVQGQPDRASVPGDASVYFSSFYNYYQIILLDNRGGGVQTN